MPTGCGCDHVCVTYDLVLDVAVELVTFSRLHQEVPAAPQRLQQLLELGLQELPPPVHLVRVLHLLPQSLHLALQLHHLTLTHLHLVLQHLGGQSTAAGSTAEGRTFTRKTLKTLLDDKVIQKKTHKFTRSKLINTEIKGIKL